MPIIIDFSMYDQWLRNHERCRLQFFYKGGLRSRAIRDPAMELGSLAHTHAEYRFLGKPIPQAELKGRDAKLIAQAETLDEALADHERAKLFRKKLAVEVEYQIKLGNGHVFVGRGDEVVQDKSVLYGVERKTQMATSSDKFSFEQKWKHNIQAELEIAGFRSAGHDVKGIIVCTTVAKTPPLITEQLIQRTDAQIKYALDCIQQAADQIAHKLEIVGPDTPWEHATFCYPCNYMNGRGKSLCEYADLCKNPHPSKELLAQFEQRKEHLRIVGSKRRA